LWILLVHLVLLRNFQVQSLILFFLTLLFLVCLY
jgi:hypothetical protein